MASLIDDSGTTRFEGTITGAGVSPVTCYLRALGLDVASQAPHDALWSDLFDNPWDTNPLASIPAGLGLSFAFDGSDAMITADEAGTWAFTFFAQVNTDVTFAGALHDSFLGTTALAAVPAAIGFIATPAPVYHLPAGAFFTPRIDTLTAATAGSLTCTVDLVIVRLG